MEYRGNILNATRELHQGAHRNNTEQDTAGLSWVPKPSHVPHFFFVGKGFWHPRPSLGRLIQLVTGTRELQDT